MNKNYFQFNNKLVGSPTSGIMSEIFLQNMKNEHFQITRKHKTRLLA